MLFPHSRLPAAAMTTTCPSSGELLSCRVLLYCHSTILPLL
jgi:hypothetical protein